MKKLNREQMEVIKEKIMDETFPERVGRVEEVEDFLEGTVEVILKVIIKFMMKYQEEIGME